MSARPFPEYESTHLVTGAVDALMIPAAEILAKYGVNAALSATAIRVAVIARLPRSEDRKLFDALAEKCMTHVELVELAATTLGAFERRQTPLRPPPSGEDRPDLRCK